MNEVALATRGALWVTLQLGGPPLVALLTVGLVVAIMQALTQVNEATLAFLPKMGVLGATLLLLGPFMVGVMQGYATELFGMIVAIGGRH